MQMTGVYYNKLLLDHDQRAYSEPDVSPVKHTPPYCEPGCYRTATPQSKTYPELFPSEGTAGIKMVEDPEQNKI